MNNQLLTRVDLSLMPHRALLQEAYLSKSAGLSWMCRMVSLEYTTSYDSGDSSQLVMSAISKVTCNASKFHYVPDTSLLRAFQRYPLLFLFSH